MLISIVVPCYNSEKTVETLTDQCFEAFEAMPGYECEVVLVNDYSRDGTWDAICRACAKHPRVRGLNMAKNFGQHAAIMAGLKVTEGEMVVGMDDDLQNHPSQIKQFIDKADEGYDVVFGVYRQKKFSRVKNAVSAVSHFFLMNMIDRPDGIDESNFWLARRYVVDKVLEYEGSSVFVQMLFFRTTHNIANIEIEHFERGFGSSNYTFRKGLRLFVSIINYSAIPLRMALIFGSLFSLAGLICTIIVIINKVIHPNVAVGWSSLMCVLLIGFGIMFLLVGIVGEYVGKIIMMMGKTPQYVVRDSVNVSDDDAQDEEIL